MSLFLECLSMTKSMRYSLFDLVYFCLVNSLNIILVINSLKMSWVVIVIRLVYVSHISFLQFWVRVVVLHI